MHKSLLSIVCHFLAVLGVVLAAQPLEAATGNFQSGNWSGKPMFKKTGQFARCFMNVKYRNGITLGFDIDRKYTWAIWLYRPKWNLNKGAKLPTQIVVDGANAINVTAAAISPKLIMIPLKNSARIVKLMRGGNTMRINLGPTSVPFKLQGTSKAISKLSRCVARQLALETGRRDTLGVKSSGKRDTLGIGGPAARPKPKLKRRANTKTAGLAKFKIGKAQSAILVSNLLSATGIPGYKIVAPDKNPLPSYDVVWHWPNGVVGAFAGFKNVQGVNLETIVSLVVADDSKICKGDFASGRKKSQVRNSLTVQRAFTACDAGKKSFEAHYSFMKSANGKLFKFAHISLNGVAKEKLVETENRFLQAANFTSMIK